MHALKPCLPTTFGSLARNKLTARGAWEMYLDNVSKVFVSLTTGKREISAEDKQLHGTLPASSALWRHTHGRRVSPQQRARPAKAFFDERKPHTRGELGGICKREAQSMHRLSARGGSLEATTHLIRAFSRALPFSARLAFLANSKCSRVPSPDRGTLDPPHTNSNATEPPLRGQSHLSELVRICPPIG